MQRELPVVYLKAGEMHFTQEPALVITVLGSCLSVTMHSRRTAVGGICHGLMPGCEARAACTRRCSEAFKYVECSILHMLRFFDKAGARRSEIDVMCFGGADMFSRTVEKPGLVSVGRQNIMTAEKILRREGLAIRKRDVGGLYGRKIFFYTETGEVLLKRLTGIGVVSAGRSCRKQGLWERK